ASRSNVTTLNAELAELAEKKFSLRVLRVLRFSFLLVVPAAVLTAQIPAPPLGRISFPTSGSSQAQPLFVRGVLFLHSFEYDDAIDAFRQAQKIDPGFAMAYWGEALAYDQPLWENEDPAKARAVLARRPKGPVTAREQGYL